MNIMDKSRAITAEDLIRRYDLESLKNNRKNIKIIQGALTKVDNILNNFIDSVLKGISNDQVDGKVSTWFFNGVPTLNNSPASDWEDNSTKNNHLGDLYYDKSTGNVYQFDVTGDVYSWVQIVDEDVIEAMALANSNPDTEDGKRDIFVIEPTTPYAVGDIWLKENGDIYRCVVARESGDFNDAEWVISSEYSNDNYVYDARAILDSFTETITASYISKVLVKTTKDSIELSVESVTGGYNGTLATLKSSLELADSQIRSQLTRKVNTTDLQNSYSTTTEMTNTITQEITDNNTNYVAVELNKKVNETDVTGAYLVLKINGDSSSGTLNADKVNISANDVLNILSGNTINLSSKNIIIASNNFNVDVNGNATMANATITGGSLSLTSIGENAKITIKDSQYATACLEFSARAIKWIGINNGNLLITNATQYPTITLKSANNEITSLSPINVTTPHITAGNIDKGTGSINSNQWKAFYFSNDKIFSTPPVVVANTTTSTSGVMVVKIKDIDTSGFWASIGGNAAPNDVTFNWIAIG